MTHAGARVACVACALATLLGCASQTARQISSSGLGAYEVDLATSADRIAAAWYDTRDGNAEIYLRFVSASGRPATAERRLTQSPEDSYEADVALLAEGIAVTWYERAANGHRTARIGLWGFDGRRHWQRALTDGTGETRNPAVVAIDDRLFVAWIEAGANGTEAVAARWIDAAGTPIGPVLALGLASETTWNLNTAATPDGRVLVVFDALLDNEAEELYLAEVTGETVVRRQLTADDGFRSKYPDIAAGPDGRVLVWHDERDGNTEVYLHAARNEAPDGTIDNAARRVTDTQGDTIGAYIVYNAGHYGLAWCDATGGLYDVFFQLIDVDGTLDGTTQHLHASSADSLIPAIEPWGAGFVVAWNEVVRSERGYHDADTRSEILLRVVVP